MPRLITVGLVYLAYISGLFALSCIVPRSFYLFLLIFGLVLLGISFDREKFRLLVIILVLCLGMLPWVFSMDVRVFLGHSKKGVFVMPIKYSVDAKIENGVCPGGDIVDRFSPTRAIVISL